MKISSQIYQKLGYALWLTAIILTLVPIWPHLYYRFSPNTSSDLASTIASTAFQSDLPIYQPSAETTQKPFSLPQLNLSLPQNNGLIIEKIGVKGEIHEGENWEEILKDGIWRVPNFPTPSEDSSLPVIIAAHRWGYLNWTNSFRTLNSFYRLPSLKVGEKIKINWEQRQYEYIIYSTSTGTQITDYSADLILYTCQLWNSPERFFVYAKRNN